MLSPSFAGVSDSDAFEVPRLDSFYECTFEMAPEM